MAAQSFRERNGLQEDADLLPGLCRGSGLEVAHAWLECRAPVGEGSSGGGEQPPSLKALGLPAVRTSSAPAFSTYKDALGLPRA